MNGRRFILFFSAFFVLLGVANIVEGFVRHESFWLVLGIAFVVLAFSTYIVRRRGW